VVTVADTLAPSLTCPDLVVALGVADQVTVTLAGLGATASDNCGARWLPFEDLVLSRQDVGVKTIVRLTATDEAGHMAACTLRIFVVDSADEDGVAKCPNAPERLNGLDDNGDGLVDEGFVSVGNGWNGGNGVKLFPVPARDRLNVECFSRQKSVPFQAWITGVTGQVWRTYRQADFSGCSLETDLTTLPPGFYLFKIVFKDGRTGAARFQKI
jgi:hypothetical protein